MKEVEGFEEFVRACTGIAERLQGPQLTRAVKKGAVIAQRAIRAQAPVDTGDLREGLILAKEKAKVRGKAVYQVVPDPAENSNFQKPIKNPVRSESRYAYYPASQEFGYFTRRPGGGMLHVRVLPSGYSYALRPGGIKDYLWQQGSSKTLMNKVPGKHYMRAGAEAASSAVKETIAKSILQEIEKGYGD